jgi:Amt family ammonium transporter
VHITSGVSALVAALVLGKRTGDAAPEPHNATMTVLGASLLWFGWFGFNGGSALGANELAVTALVTTHTAAVAGALMWTGLGWLRHRRVSVVGATAGAVAGLVAITPAAGFVTPLSALFIGLIGGAGCFVVVELFVRGRVDDALDVFGVHGAGGILGAILAGVFASKGVNTAGADALLHGSPTLLIAQLIAVGVVIAYSAVMTWILLRLIRLVTPLRVSEQQEQDGLDRAVHGEDAYIFEGEQ